ncbi:tetratricopeptide repeat protein [Rubripirellula amarantea]|nr:tetratricopeptide repeat protein [Rubripirellula amarantea]
MKPTTQLNHRQSLWFAIALTLLTMFAYLPAMNAGFIWDDDDYVINNDTLRDVNGLWRIWTDPAATPQYYPFVHSTFWLEYQTWGLNARGYHIVNIIIHMLNALLLWRVCRRLDIPLAWLIGLIFALHPVHVESVAWITERKNVLSGLFYLGSASAYLRFLGSSPRQDGEAGKAASGSNSNWKFYGLSLALFGAALLSKTVTATLPAALVLLIWWKHGTVSRRRILELVPMFVVGIGFGMLTVWLEKYHVGAEGIDWDLSLLERFLIAGRVICFYAAKLLVPLGLVFTYPRWDVDASQTWQYFFPIIVAGTIVSLFVLRNRISRGPVVAFCFFCGTLFPALGFFDVYPMRFSFVADHFQYLASIGMIVLYVQLVSLAFFKLIGSNEQSRNRGLIAVACLLSLVLGTLTWKQTLIYKDLETLWRDTIARNPTSWMAHNNLGALLNRRGDYAEASEHLMESMRLKPNFADSVSNLGKAREGLGDFAQAQTLYEQAVQISPTHAKALNNLAAIYGMQGRLDESRQLIDRALQSDPTLAAAFGNLGSLESVQGNLPAAIEHYRRSLELDPSLTDVRLNLAKLFIQKADFSSARQELQTVLDQSPRNVSALLNLGIVYVNQDQLSMAVDAFEKVLDTDSENVPAMRNLAYTLRLMGRDERAEALSAAADRIANPPQ